MTTIYKVFRDENGQFSAKSRMYAISQNGKKIESISVSSDDSNWGAPAGDKILKMRPVKDEQFKAYDPKTGDIIDVRASDQNVRIARMRHALNMNPYKTLSNGLFSGNIEENDPNDNIVFNLVREIGRAPVNLIATMPQNLGALGSAIINGDKATKNSETGEWETRGAVLLKSATETKDSINKSFGAVRDGVTSDIGSAIGSAAAAIGSAWLSGGTAAPAIMFGIDAGGNALNEGMKAGVDSDEALNRALGVGVSNAIIERFGMNMIWKSASKTIGQRAIQGLITEGGEEALQGITEDVIMNKVRGKSIVDIISDGLYQGAIGGVVGAGMGAVAGGNIEGIKQGLKERGLTDAQADILINKTIEAASNTQVREKAIKDAIDEEREKAEFIRENQEQIQPVLQAVINDAVAAARNDVDIRQTIKDRAQGVDAQTQEIVADSVQAFADKIADDFGITQREFVDKTGLTVQTESGDTVAQKFADGTQINENGEFVDENGNVLFQRIGKKGARKEELDALDMALQMENIGFDNDSIKKSTGWARGLDGKMWLESGGDWGLNKDATVKLAQIYHKGGELKLSDIVSTDNFNRYPKLADAKIRIVKMPNEDFGMRIRGGAIEINASKANSDGVALLRSLVHETDHLISRIEGFARGSNANPKTVQKQVEIHKDRLMDGLEELGLKDEFESALAAQGEEKSYVDALDVVVASAYTQEDMPAIQKKLNSLYVDAIIIDRYDADVLNKLSEEDRKLRLHEAYYYTIGEIYARRAAKNANRDAKELRDKPDETGKYAAEIAGYFALSPAPAGGITLSDQRAIDAIRQFSEELDAQQEQTRFNQSAFAGSRVDYDRPSLEAIGSGEGAQAHGWGLYYALNKEVAENYRSKFMAQSAIEFDFFVDGVHLDIGIARLLNNKFNSSLYEVVKTGDKTKFKEQVNRAIEGMERGDYLEIISRGDALLQKIEANPNMSIAQFERELPNDSDKYRWQSLIKGARNLAKQQGNRATIANVKDMIERHLASFKSSNEQKKQDAAILRTIDLDKLEVREQQGQVHEVDLPENPYLLDEQKPLNEQSEYVQNAIKAVAAEINQEIAPGMTWNPDMTGRNIYYLLEHAFGSKKKASQLLEKHGIKGIAYRGGADGRCFVIFNPDDVRVIRKFYEQDENGDVRGYFDWTNKMQQVIQIMKTGDLDTVMHELGHFFSVNYIHMAIETGKLDNVRPLMEYYQVQNPRELIVREDIQEDLAVKFLTYLKTDESPRGFRKYFDAVRDWLAAAWERLRGQGLVKDGDLPDEIVRFFDSITIVKPKNLNLDRVAASKEQLRGVLRKAKNGTLEDVSDQQLHDIEQLLKAARARIPRMPKSLYSKLWGSLNTRFAETHDLAALMGIDDKIKHLATRKSGGIANENDLMDFLREEGLMFGDSWDNNASQDSQAWDDALRIIANARNEYSIDDVARIEEINQLTQAKEDALDILGNIDPYDALATIEAAKKNRNQELRAEERTAKMQLKTLESDYKRIKTQNLRLQAKNLESKTAFKSAVNFLYAQDLPTDTKARFLRKLNKVYDMRTLGKWMQEVREKAHRMYSEAANRAQRERLNNELKETFARNKRNMKYDYEHNKLFNDLRRYNRMSVNDAIAEIQQFYIDPANPTPLSREDELRKMMLHYRTQRGGTGGMSAAFMDELISRVQEAKLIGRDAIDEIQFERGVNRIQAQEDVLDAIATNKNPNALQRGYLRVIGNLKSTIDAITNSLMADKFDMVEKEIKASIAGKKRINETLDEIAKMNELPHGRNQLWEYKQELLKPIEGLHVWYVDHGGKKVWYDEKGFSRGQIMSMWNLYKDKDSHQLMDKFYTENQIHQLFGYLTEADKRTADLMMDRLGDIYDMVNPVYVKVWQRDMPHRLNYWPRQSAHEQDHDLIETFDGTRQEANFTKSRSHGAVPVFYKDALSIYEAHEMDAQYMVHQALAYKELADTFSHTTVQQAIRNKFGSKVLETLNDHIKAVSIGGVRKSRNAVTDTITKYVGQYTVAKIALNPSVLGGQLSAYHAYSNNMPTATYYKDLAYGIGHMRETHKFMKKYVGDYLENRISGGFNETLKAMMDYDKAGAKRAKLNEFLTSWVRNADYASIVWGGYPRLKYLLEETDKDGNLVRSQDAAVRQWITETEETMQSHTQASLSQMQRQGGWNSLFTTFKNQQSQYMRKIFDAWFEFGRGEISGKQFGKTIANYLVIQSALFAIMRWSVRAAIGITGDDEEPMDNIIDAIVQGTIDPIPIVNEIGNMAMQQLKDGKTYGAKVQLLGVDDGMRAIEKALKLMTSESTRDRADWHDYTSVIAPFIEMTTSLPVSQYNRILEKWGL